MRSRKPLQSKCTLLFMLPTLDALQPYSAAAAATATSTTTSDDGRSADSGTAKDSSARSDDFDDVDVNKQVSVMSCCNAKHCDIDHALASGS